MQTIEKCKRKVDEEGGCSIKFVSVIQSGYLIYPIPYYYTDRDRWRVRIGSAKIGNWTCDYRLHMFDVEII